MRMRKLITMMLVVVLMVGFTGFAGAKVVDTGPPEKQQTTVKKDVTDQIVYEYSQVAVILDVADATNAMDGSTIYANDPASLPAPAKVSTAFIDRHRRLCNTGKDFNTTDPGRSTPGNSLAFIDRHRRLRIV